MDERKICQSTMSEQEINMWSIMIAVMKNQGKEYGTVDNIVSDIEVIKDMIKLLK